MFQTLEEYATLWYGVGWPEQVSGSLHRSGKGITHVIEETYQQPLRGIDLTLSPKPKRLQEQLTKIQDSTYHWIVPTISYNHLLPQTRERKAKA